VHAIGRVEKSFAGAGGGLASTRRRSGKPLSLTLLSRILAVRDDVAQHADGDHVRAADRDVYHVLLSAAERECSKDAYSRVALALGANVLQ
jgi:hypothetical protein